MMRALLPALAAALALLPACGLDEIDQFDMPVDGQFKLPGSPLGSVPFIDSLPFPGLTSQQFQKAFEEHDTSAAEVESVKLGTLEIEVTDPAGGNLDFVDRITFFVESPGLQKRKLAEKVPVPAGTGKITLDMENVELKPYVTAEEMVILMELEGTMPTVDTTLRARAVFEIDLGIL